MQPTLAGDTGCVVRGAHSKPGCERNKHDDKAAGSAGNIARMEILVDLYWLFL